MGNFCAGCATGDLYKDVPDVWFESQSAAEVEYEFGKRLGAGAFAEVRVVTKRKTRVRSAGKRFSKKFHFGEGNELQFAPEAKALREEVAILKLLGGRDGCMALHGLIETPSELWLLLEFCEHGDLMGHVETRSVELTEDDAARWSSQLLKAINRCHELHVMHRDIKPENVMIAGADEHAVLGDFGSAVRWHGKTPERFAQERGSSFWSAPETWAGDYDYRADLWSCGLVVLVLVDGMLSGEEIRVLHAEGVDAAFRHSAKYEHKKHHPIGKDLHAVLDALLTSADERKNPSDVIKMPWFKKSSAAKKKATITTARDNAARYNASAKLERAVHVALATLLTASQRAALRRELDSDDLLSRASAERATTEVAPSKGADSAPLLDNDRLTRTVSADAADAVSETRKSSSETASKNGVLLVSISTLVAAIRRLKAATPESSKGSDTDASFDKVLDILEHDDASDAVCHVSLDASVRGAKHPIHPKRIHSSSHLGVIALDDDDMSSTPNDDEAKETDTTQDGGLATDTSSGLAGPKPRPRRAHSTMSIGREQSLFCAAPDTLDGTWPNTAKSKHLQDAAAPPRPVSRFLPRGLSARNTSI